MHDEEKELLNKVDGSKRDFVKKLAIGTAYAVPVISTFSLDSIRKSARAQGVYGDPAVVTVRAVEDTDFNPGAGQVGAATAHYTAFWVITFDRPMNKKHKDAIWYNTFGERCTEPESAVVGDSCELGEINKCGGGEAWSWTEDGTQLFMGFHICQGDGLGLDVVLNPGGSCEAKPFQDMEGNKLPRTEGCGDYCEERDIECP